MEAFMYIVLKTNMKHVYTAEYIFIMINTYIYTGSINKFMCKSKMESFINTVIQKRACPSILD